MIPMIKQVSDPIPVIVLPATNTVVEKIKSVRDKQYAPQIPNFTKGT